MKRWIVTGFNHRCDGLLYAIDAENEEMAYRKVASINDMVYKKVETKDRDNKKVMVHALCDKDVTNENIVNEYRQSRPLWWWEMHAQELKLNINHEKVVCW